MTVERPLTLSDAIRFLRDNPGAKLVAGGTDLIPRINQRLERHELLCYIDSYPEMLGVERLPVGGALIGALVKLADVAESPLLAPYKAITEAASKVASPQIRNQATVGGNILQENRCMFFNNQVPWSDVNRCFKWGGDRCLQYKGSRECVALFQSDLAPALMVFDATAVIAGSDGERLVPVSELYLAAGEKSLSHDEILTGVLLPAPGKNEASAYVRKTVRGSFDFPLISCAARLCADNGLINSASVVFGAAGTKPEVLKAVREALRGKPVSSLSALVPALEASVQKVIKPFRDTRVNAGVRVDMAKSVFRKALFAAASALRAE